jgi:hypothetical protein
VGDPEWRTGGGVRPRLGSEDDGFGLVPGDVEWRMMLPERRGGLFGSGFDGRFASSG